MADAVTTDVNETTPTKPATEKPKRGRKKGDTTKATTVAAKKKDAKSSVKKSGSKPVKKNDGKVSATVEKNQALGLNYKSITIEFDGKKLSEKELFNKVQGYIKNHPYIIAHDIEIFVKPNESCAYFTVDGYSNPDFKIEL